MALFTQYAMSAAKQALSDANWAPSTLEEMEETGVCVGSGIGNFEDMYNTSIAFHEKVSSSHGLFRPN